MGAANKVSGNIISGKKVLKKINPRKRKTQNCESCIFTFQRTFFLTTFLYKIIMEPEKKSQKIKSRIERTLFPETFLKKGLFSTGLFQCEILGLFPETFFQGLFWRSPYILYVDTKTINAEIFNCFDNNKYIYHSRSQLKIKKRKLLNNPSLDMQTQSIILASINYIKIRHQIS